MHIRKTRILGKALLEGRHAPQFRRVHTEAGPAFHQENTKDGLYDLVPAMCHLDYTMSELGGTSSFVREYTLASGGPYCDCGYKKKGH